MSMRSHKRAVARFRMKCAGAGNINKRKLWDKNAGKKKAGKFRSYFAMKWRDYLDYSTKEYKWYLAGLNRRIDKLDKKKRGAIHA